MCEKCNSERTGDGWKDFLAKYQIAGICNNNILGNAGWRVSQAISADYQVESIALMDGNGCMRFRMRCSCPAMKPCQHIDAVMQMRYAEESAAARGGDTDGMEILERTEIEGDK